ncbi:MAG: LysR family transcriptional regulator [Myxococcota bacterium]
MMTELPRVEWLQAFVVFAEHMNFTRAAKPLGLTQPALHGQIGRLTEAIGVPLYVRRGRGLALTTAGRETLRFARTHLASLHTFVARARGDVSDAPLALAAGEGAYLYLLGGGISKATERGGPLRLLTRDREGVLEAVRQGDADLGVAVLDADPAGLSARPLRTVPMVVAMPKAHPLCARAWLSPRSLDDVPLIVPPPDRPHRQQLARALADADAQLRVAVEASGWPLMLHFAALGVGLAVVNGCAAVPSGLVTRPLRGVPKVTYATVVHPQRRGDPRVAALVDDLRSGLPAT